MEGLTSLESCVVKHAKLPWTLVSIYPLLGNSPFYAGQIIQPMSLEVGAPEFLSQGYDLPKIFADGKEAPPSDRGEGHDHWHPGSTSRSVIKRTFCTLSLSIYIYIYLGEATLYYTRVEVNTTTPFMWV